MKLNNNLKNENVVALIYARVSSTRQKIEGHGLDSQVHRCIEYAVKNGWQVSEDLVFKDDFTGGGDFMNRPAMRSLLAYVDAHPYKNFVIVFDDLKRFARDVQFHMQLRTALAKRGVIPHCLNYDFDDSPEGMFVETIFAAGNELDRAQNRRQVIQKQQAILEMGGYPFGGLKIGYRTYRDPVTRRNIKVPDELSSVIIEGLEGFAYKRFENRIALARFWKEKGVFKKQSAEMCLGTVDKMLKDPFFAGFVEYLPWEVSRRKGWHEALISQEVFDLNQRRLNAETTGTRIRHIHNPDFELCGMVKCSECDHLLRSYWSKGRTKKYPYYECKNKDCSLRNKSIGREEIEEGFKNIIKEYTPRKGLTEVASAMFDDIWKVKFQQTGENISKLNKLIDSLSTDIAQLSDKHAKATEGSFLEAELAKRIEEKAQERKDILEKLNSKSDPQVSYRTASDKVLSAIKSPLKLWTSASIKQKKQVFFFFFDERLVYERKKSYRTAQISPVLRLFERNDSSNSLDVEMTGIEPVSESGCGGESTVCS